MRFELSAVNPPAPPTFTEGYGSVHFSTKNQVEKSILCFAQESRWADWTLTWKALTRYIDDGDVPISNNWVENQIRPIALGRSNWLFAGSLRAGQRAAAVMSLVHSAKINGHDPYAYLKDVLERLPKQPASRIEELLPHRWTPLAVAH